MKSPELGYLIGTLQGDGCYYQYPVNDRGKIRVRQVIKLDAKDLEMIEKSKGIFEKVFKRKRKTYQLSDGRFGFSFLVRNLLNKFKELDMSFKDPPKPPEWVKHKIEFFGPYLAGLIDSDGDVRIKRPKYPQCAIRITSGHRQKNLEISIEKNFNCGASITEERCFNKKWKIWNHGSRLEFLISSKNFKKFKRFVLPYIMVPRKKIKIENYINNQ